ncbi:Carboxylesterase, type B [Cordyceps fumosorosea ARSEF 2679]|uniref:Carboxylesterase, type B n=1 Tax=Cordyceps fumosorosea (strain ARSEF 2679) TaxID=1081104 RepID=A0A167ACX2_CORFA|nr:Carboxylesterase, type B [Cordyceps fumosorosea ARSEF 2679]OAA38785.1 Carboxylesterase, type B [Cordyceps fumosorosea ARSEF 2679]
MALLGVLSSQNTATLAAGMFSYYVCIYALHRLMKHAFRDFYQPLLRQNGVRRALRLPVFIMGILATLTTAPVCGRAFLSEGSPAGPLTPDSHICIGTRLVLWTAELPLLGSTRFYLVHHLLSLAGVCVVLANKLDVAPINLILAGLVTELFSSTRAFLREAGLDRSRPGLLARVTGCNALSVLALRGLPAAYLLLQGRMLRPALRSRIGLAYLCAVALYAAFAGYMAYGLLAGLGRVSFWPARPASFVVRVGRKERNVSVYSVFLGMAIAAVEVSAAALYELTIGESLAPGQLSSLAAVGLGSVVSGLVGAKAMNTALSVRGMSMKEEEETAAPSSPCSPVSSRLFPGYKGLSIQGAILFSAMWLHIYPLVGFNVNQRLLFSAVGMSLPLGEAVGRVGCYFAGCCGSTRGRKYPAIQLLAAVLNLGFFFFGLMELGRRGVSAVGELGLAAVVANGAVRLVLNPLRSDTGETMLSPASVFAWVQVLGSLSLLALESAEGAADLGESAVAALGTTCSSLLACRIASFGWKMAAAELGKWNLTKYSRPENLVYACLRQVPFERLNAILNGTVGTSLYNFWPAVDGDLLQDAGSAQLDGGAFVKVPVISGTNKDEGTTFIPVGINTTAQFRDFLIVGKFGFHTPASVADKFLQLVPRRPVTGHPRLPGRPARALQGIPVAPDVGAHRRLRDAREPPAAVRGVGRGRRRRRTATASTCGPATCRWSWGASHFEEEAFVFNNVTGQRYHHEKPFDGMPETYVQLSEVMASMWASFVHDLDPNTGSERAPLWEAHAEGEPTDLLFSGNASSYVEADTWRTAALSALRNVRGGEAHPLRGPLPGSAFGQAATAAGGQACKPQQM